jgi:DNA ligase-1
LPSRQALHESLRETVGECSFAKSKTSSALEELQAFLDEAVTDCTEGLMVKAMDATYEPSKRSLNWLKLKKDYMEGAADSFDVVPIGAWYASCLTVLAYSPIDCLSPAVSCVFTKDTRPAR